MMWYNGEKCMNIYANFMSIVAIMVLKAANTVRYATCLAVISAEITLLQTTGFTFYRIGLHSYRIYNCIKPSSSHFAFIFILFIGCPLLNDCG